MPFEPGLNKYWYLRGRTAAKRRNYVDMYGAWHDVKDKPPTLGKRITAQESFFQGYMDVAQKNPEIHALVRRLPDGRVQLKINPSVKGMFRGLKVRVAKLARRVTRRNKRVGKHTKGKR